MVDVDLGTVAVLAAPLIAVRHDLDAMVVVDVVYVFE